MLTHDKAKKLKEDLFGVVQYCHDNDKDFFQHFCSMDIEKLESINAIYLSGSSAVMMITYWYHDELIDINIPIIIQSLLEWVIEHQSTNNTKR